MKKRVLFLQQNGVLGGAELYLLHIAQTFKDAALVVLFAEGPLRERLQAAGVQVVVLPSEWAQSGVRGGKPRPDVSGVLAVLKLVARTASLARDVDVIFANSPKAMTVAWLAGLLSRRPVIWAFHDLLAPEHFSPEAMRQMARIGSWGADRILACSGAGAESLVRQGVRPERIHVVYHGIDVKEFDAKPADETLRQELNLGDGPVAGVFGRITSWKGQHVAVELLGRIPELRLLIVGDTDDPSYLQGIYRRAEQLNATERLSVIGHRSDIPNLMRSVDVVLHTSVAPEPFGRVIVEAMLAGKPVVASRGGGVSEIVESGVTGILTPPGDAGALAAAVSELLREPERASTMARAGFERARARFTLTEMLESIERHVTEVTQQ